MPTTYTHYRFGEEVRKMVGPEAAKAIDAYPQLFRIGVHGPDLLFYYNALGKNEVNQLGVKLHDLPGSYFFDHAAEVIRNHPGEDAYLAYLYGFLCHFALDVGCHGYIQEKIDASGITHSEIEAEFDAALMKKDGYDPVRHRVTGHLKASEENAEVIQAFFDEVDEKKILKCIKDMILLLNVLVAPSKLKRGVIFGALKLAKHYELHHLVVNYEENKQCEDSTKKLVELYEQSKPVAAKLIDDFMGIVEKTKEPDGIYHYDFCSNLVKDEGETSEI